MRLLLVDSWIHFKNRDSILKMCKALGIEFAISNQEEVWREEWDLVIVPSGVLASDQFPHSKKILYGPHNFVFLEEPWMTQTHLFDNRCVYNFLSDWVINMEKEIGSLALRPVAAPFPIDTERFSPNSSIRKEYDCFIYFKQRKLELLDFVKKELDKKNLKYTVVMYGKYKEDDYMDIVRKSKFGIWVGIHESQGFALEECLSMDTPLLLLDTETMFDGVNSENNQYNFQDKKGKYQFLATCAPYFNEECGIQLKKVEDLDEGIKRMLDTWPIYKPRNFVLKTLIYDVCWNRFLTA